MCTVMFAPATDLHDIITYIDSYFNNKLRTYTSCTIHALRVNIYSYIIHNSQYNFPLQVWLNQTLHQISCTTKLSYLCLITLGCIKTIFKIYAGCWLIRMNIFGISKWHTCRNNWACIPSSFLAHKSGALSSSVLKPKQKGSGKATFILARGFTFPQLPLLELTVILYSASLVYVL